MIGSWSSSADRSVEFWSPSNSEEGTCQLNDYPREMDRGPTANLVSGQLVACYYNSCEFYDNGEWSNSTKTRSSRSQHSSAVDEKKRRILLIGGESSSSTEWISVVGSPSQPGPFNVRHGNAHCTIKLSSDSILLTGGAGTEEEVTIYNITTGDENRLNGMRQGRAQHACGVYQDAAGRQVGRL